MAFTSAINGVNSAPTAAMDAVHSSFALFAAITSALVSL